MYDDQVSGVKRIVQLYPYRKEIDLRKTEEKKNRCTDLSTKYRSSVRSSHSDMFLPTEDLQSIDMDIKLFVFQHIEP